MCRRGQARGAASLYNNQVANQAEAVLNAPGTGPKPNSQNQKLEPHRLCVYNSTSFPFL